jgi:hypothetical protein
LASEVQAADQMPGQFVGMLGKSAVKLTLHKATDNTIAGMIEQTWINSAGRQKSGQADIQGVERDDVVTLYLAPQGMIKLPLVLTARWKESGLAIEDGEADEAKAPTSRLLPGNDVTYLKVLAHLPASQPHPAAQRNASLLEELEKTGIDGGEGCQCSAEKKTHVADATIAFSQQMTDLLANLDDYLGGIEANRKVLAIHGAEDPYSRRSVMAFTAVFRAVGQDIGNALNRAADKCSHRQLAEGETATREAKLWRDTCLSVADGLGRYREEQGVLSASSR